MIFLVLIGGFFSLIVILATSAKIVQPFETMVLERGKQTRVVDAGLHFVAPWAGKCQIVDMRQQFFDLQPVEVTSRDGYRFCCACEVEFTATDPVRLLRHPYGPVTAITESIERQLSPAVHDWPAAQVSSEVHVLEDLIRRSLASVADSAGVRVDSIKLVLTAPSVS